MPIDPREARKQAMLDRMNTSKKTSEGGGLGFFRGDLQNVQFWRCDEGPHELDIIPYFAGPNDPATQEGGFTYVLEVFEHRDVGGIEGQSFICMMKTYGKPCPICQHRQTLIQEGADDDLIKALRTSRYPRSIYNVVVYDTEQTQAKGVQIFHTSHYLMEQYLIKLAESSRREIEAGAPPFKFFADPEEGYSIKFERTGKGVNTRYMAHSLLSRNYQIVQQTLDLALPLDTLIYIPEFDEVYAAYWGTDETPTDAASAAPSTLVRGAPPAATSPQPVATGPQTVAPAAAAPGAFTPAPAAPAAVAPAAVEGDPVCPAGGIFGTNNYELEWCEQCEFWQSCAERSNALLAASGGAKPAVAGAPALAPAPAAPAPAPAAPASPAPAAPVATAPAPAAAPIAPAAPAAPAAPVAGAPGTRQPVGAPVGRGRGAPVTGQPAPAAPAAAPAPAGAPAGAGGGRRIVR